MHYFSSSRCMPIFILVRQLVLLVCINSALIMSPPARTINKTLLKRSSELYKFIDRVCIKIHEIHIDLNEATHGFYL